MTRPDEVWIPLVDEPIGTIVAQIQAEHAQIGELVDSPQRLLAFKTFAYIRVGLVLGELLVENDIEPYNGSKTWIEQLLGNPEYKARVVEEVQAVAEEVARDVPGEARLEPDEAARQRFRDFARRRLEQS
ncbi:MAG TPA: hypothetical protein VK496_06355 [Gaiellaceae bacterium]|jgi:hypothetical protein|nr:hypothetical protein [Gaiellaceae bacterium]